MDKTDTVKVQVCPPAAAAGSTPKRRYQGPPHATRLTVGCYWVRRCQAGDR